MGAVADAEPLRPSPAAFGVVLDVARIVSDQALVPFGGNRYSVGPGHAGEIVHVRRRLGERTLDVVTAQGVTLTGHVRQPDGAGVLVRADEHVAALERVVLANFADKPPCRRKTRRPATAAAVAEAKRVRRDRIVGEQVVLDFAAYLADAHPIGTDDAGDAS